MGDIVSRQERLGWSWKCHVYSHIKELVLYDYNSDIAVEYLLNFLPGLALNCSIKKLSIGGWNFSDGEVRNYLTQFFKHNRKFECLKVQCNPSWSTHEFALSLRLFESLTDFILISNPDLPWVNNTPIILALTGHTDLIKLTFARVEFGSMHRKNDNTRPCCDAMVTLLQNPRSKLKSLHLNQTTNYYATTQALWTRTSRTIYFKL